MKAADNRVHGRIYDLGTDYYVRPLSEDDVDGPYPSWFADQDVCRFNSHGKFFEPKAAFRSYVASIDGHDKVVWAICHASDGHIGNVSLQNISVIDRTAEFAIIIGDKRHWGHGVGKLAAVTICEHGFRKLNLERIYCGTAATNEGMKRLAEAMHMTHEGTRRMQLYLDGTRVDVLDYGVLRDEFLKRNK